MRNANSVAIAGGAISGSLIELLVKKSLIDVDEAVSVLTLAQRQVGMYLNASPDAVEASRMIGEIILGLRKNSAQP